MALIFSPTNMRTRSRAFTLIEMLTVLFILAILIALVVSVSKWVINNSNKNKTRDAMKLIIHAVKVYYDEQDPKEYPDTPATDEDFRSCSQLYLDIRNDGGKALDVIRALPERIIEGNTFHDAWDTEMQYDNNGGMGGVPGLRSAGPDGDFNTEEDNVLSGQP